MNAECGMRNAELKPCPFCGSKRVAIFTLKNNKGRFATCMNCKASTNIAAREEDAAYLWNKRAESPDENAR